MMRCPHGKEITPKSIYGIRLYEHKGGEGCKLLNSLDVDCLSIAESHLFTFINEGNIKKIGFDDHLLRLAYSTYKISVALRLRYIKFIASLDYDSFMSGFEPVSLALSSEDDLAANGLYLMELYFVFYGISGRISAVNPAVTHSALYKLLISRQLRATIYESELTRAYGSELCKKYPHYAGCARIPD